MYSQLSEFISPVNDDIIKHSEAFSKMTVCQIGMPQFWLLTSESEYKSLPFIVFAIKRRLRRLLRPRSSKIGDRYLQHNQFPHRAQVNCTKVLAHRCPLKDTPFVSLEVQEWANSLMFIMNMIHIKITNK